jgi:hypothetical protein
MHLNPRGGDQKVRKLKFLADFRKFCANSRRLKTCISILCENSRLICVNLREKKILISHPHEG